jgi:hypothetical protein
LEVLKWVAFGVIAVPAYVFAAMWVFVSYRFVNRETRPRDVTRADVSVAIGRAARWIVWAICVTIALVTESGIAFAVVSS